MARLQPLTSKPNSTNSNGKPILRLEHTKPHKLHGCKQYDSDRHQATSKERMELLMKKRSAYNSGCNTRCLVRNPLDDPRFITIRCKQTVLHSERTSCHSRSVSKYRNSQARYEMSISGKLNKNSHSTGGSSSKFNFGNFTCNNRLN